MIIIMILIIIIIIRILIFIIVISIEYVVSYVALLTVPQKGYAKRDSNRQITNKSL